MQNKVDAGLFLTSQEHLSNISLSAIWWNTMLWRHSASLFQNTRTAVPVKYFTIPFYRYFLVWARLSNNHLSFSSHCKIKHFELRRI